MKHPKFPTRTTFLLSLVSSGLFFSAHAQNKPYSVNRANGFVPNAKTAIRIAVAVWNPIYGRKNIASEKPYKASLSRGIWTVRGTLPRGWKGGVAIAEINKRDGRILRVSHGK